MNGEHEASEVTTKTSGCAIASLVCGLLSFCSGFVLGIPAIVTGHLGLSKIKKSGGTIVGSGLALAGLIIGYVTTIGSFLLLPSALKGFSEGMTQAAHLKAGAFKIQEISAKLETYRLLTGSYPTTEQGIMALVEEPMTEPKANGWKQQFTTIPLDPWGAPYHYVFHGEDQPEVFVVTTMGRDGKLGTSDDFSSSELP